MLYCVCGRLTGLPICFLESLGGSGRNARAFCGVVGVGWFGVHSFVLSFRPVDLCSSEPPRRIGCERAVTTSKGTDRRPQRPAAYRASTELVRPWRSAPLRVTARELCVGKEAGRKQRATGLGRKERRGTTTMLPAPTNSTAWGIDLRQLP